PNVREVIEKVNILKDKITHGFTKKFYKPLALRIIDALAVHRLTTGDIFVPIGLTPEELRDTLCLHLPLPEPNADFLKTTIESVLKEIIKTVSGQFISLNPENNQYYLDIKKDIDFDALIVQRAESLDDNYLDRYYFEILAQLMECPNVTYVPGFKIWWHEIVWLGHKITRQGYLFFGAPNERSTAQPPRDFYLYFLQPFAPPVFTDEKRPDEVFFMLKQYNEEFLSNLRLYAGAREMFITATRHNKPIYAEKAENYLKKLTRWLRENILTTYEVVYKGISKPLLELVRGKIPPQATLKEIINTAASICLSPYFEERYPEYPKFSYFKSPVTTENVPVYVQDALKWLTGIKTKNGSAMLSALELLDGEKVAPENSRYARWVKELLAEKGQGRVINRSELVETLYTSQGIADIERTPKYQLEPELLVVILAALVFSGDIIWVFPGQRIDASNLHILSKMSLSDLKNFKHIEPPKELPLNALKALFEFLNLPPGLIVNKATQEEGIRQMQKEVNNLLEKTLLALQKVQAGIPCGEKKILDVNTQQTYKTALENFKIFLESLERFDTPAKLRNFKYSVSEIAQQKEALKIIKTVQIFSQTIDEISPFLVYLNKAAQVLPRNHPWVDKLNSIQEKLYERIRQNEGSILKTELKALKEEYINIYLKLHQKHRLTASEDEKKKRLLKDKRLSVLRQLANIPLLPRAQLAVFEDKLTTLKPCWQLTKADLEGNVLCPHCHFHPAEEKEIIFNRSEGMDALEDELQTIYDEWTQTLLQSLNDPMVKGNLALLKPEEREKIEQFIQTGNLPEPITNTFIKSLQQILQGIEKAEISLKRLKETLGNGIPLTIDEVKERFDKLLFEITRGKDKNRVRVVVRE
ncbi:MAG: ATP-binding protein, partial [Candidatus Desulfofervidaceae bacterium]|nr:ATP-binding protein [Candidatus Desulfofervidaceae bacterium]